MARKKQIDIMKDLQENPDYIILNNPLSTPKLVRKLGRNKEVTPSEIYTPKLFYDLISRLQPEHLEGIRKDQNVTLTIDIGEFLKSIEAGNSKSLYSHVIECIDLMLTTMVKWSDAQSDFGTTIISFYEHHKGSGKVDVQMHSEFVKKVLEVTHHEHFSFLKKHLLRLKNGQAIKLFPYFVSWKNRGLVDLSLEAFKKKFGYNTSGYIRFPILKKKVLEPALREINEKTDLTVTYETIGENLDSKKPRVSGLRFFIVEKSRKKVLKSDMQDNGLFKQEDIVEYIQPITQTQNIKEQETNPLFVEFSDKVAERFGVSAKDFMKAIEGKTKADILQACDVVEERRVKGSLRDSAGLFLKALKEGYKSSEQIKKDAREIKQKKTTEQVTLLRKLEERKEEIKAQRREGVNEVIRILIGVNPNITLEAKEKIDKRNSILKKYTVEELRVPENKRWRDIFIEEFVKEYPDAFKNVTELYDQELKKIEIEKNKIEKGLS